MSTYILKDENMNQPENFILKRRYATFHLQSIVIPFFSLELILKLIFQPKVLFFYYTINI